MNNRNLEEIKAIFCVWGKLDYQNKGANHQNLSAFTLLLNIPLELNVELT